MRFITKAPGLTVTVFHDEAMIVTTPTGTKMIPDPRAPGLIAHFTQGGLAPWEKEAALERFDVRGLGAGENPIHRFGFYDTELEQITKGWTEEFRFAVETRLQELADNSGGFYFRVDRPRVKPPWPTYDQLNVHGRRSIEMVAEQIATKIVEDGYDLDQAIMYEAENKNRPEVIQALEQAKVNKEEGVIEVSA